MKHFALLASAALLSGCISDPAPTCVDPDVQATVIDIHRQQLKNWASTIPRRFQPEDRYSRALITPGGRSGGLEIDGTVVFLTNTTFENHNSESKAIECSTTIVYNNVHHEVVEVRVDFIVQPALDGGDLITVYYNYLL